MRSDPNDNWQSIGSLAGGVVTRLRDVQMRREFVRRVDDENFASMCERAGVNPASIPDANPLAEAAE